MNVNSIKDISRHPAGMVVLITLSCIAIFYDTWSSIVETWISIEAFRHGFIVAPISLWLIWTKKEYLKNLCPEPTRVAVLLILLNGMLWLAADLINVMVIKQFAVVGVLLSCLWGYLGSKFSKQILFPLLFLYFLVPFGEPLYPYLMEFTANFTVKMLRLTGITVYQEGLYFTLTSGSWSVIEACSGLRYLLATVILGFVYAYLNYTRFYKRIIFFTLSIIVPIIANGFRAYMIVMIGHLSDMTLAVGVDHLFYGAAFFAIVIFALFYVGSFWKDAPLPVQAGSADTDVAAIHQGYTTYKLTSIFILMCIAMVLWPLGANWLKLKYSPSMALNSTLEYKLPQHWQRTEVDNWPWKPALVGAKSESMSFFTDGNKVISFFQANFGDERQGAELISDNNVLRRLVGDSWQLMYTKKIPIKRADGSTIIADESQLKNDDKKLVLLVWYQIGDKNTANPYIAKFYQLVKRLVLDTSPEIQIMLMAEDAEYNGADIRASLQQFAEVLLINNDT